MNHGCSGYSAQVACLSQIQKHEQAVASRRCRTWRVAAPHHPGEICNERNDAALQATDLFHWKLQVRNFCLNFSWPERPRGRFGGGGPAVRPRSLRFPELRCSPGPQVFAMGNTWGSNAGCSLQSRGPAGLHRIAMREVFTQLRRVLTIHSAIFH